ncbi:hypothetical protein K474DRAFT_1663523 [Panus rudis PR-1116 ss-1]|nr:hypothetical protein K474DRAFT_1663523 [Panus rudis PR-1116 ss-1]
MSFLEKYYLLSLMHTSKQMHELGLPVLLGSPLVLWPWASRSFSEFLNTDISRYAPLLRDIRLPYIQQEREVREAVSDLNPLQVMKHATNLRSLRVMKSETVCKACPKFASGLRSLPNLRQLWFGDLHHSIYKELARGTWPLTHLYLKWDNIGREYDLASLFKRFAQTLELIDVDFVDFTELKDVVFPRMRVVCVDHLQVDDWVETRDLVREFPNLRTFHVKYDHDEVHPEDCEEQRAMNELDPGQTYHWKDLDDITVSYNILYSLNIHTSTRCLLPEPPYDDVEFDPMVLINCRPKALMAVLNVEFLRHLPAVWPQCPQIAHLYYHVRLNDDFEYEAGTDNLKSLMEEFLDAHKTASCPDLRLVFKFAQGSKYDWDNIFESRNIGVKDAAGFAQKLVDAMPSLRTIEIQGYRHSFIFCPDSWMGKVINTDEGRKVVEAKFERSDVFKPGPECNEWGHGWYCISPET